MAEIMCRASGGLQNEHAHTSRPQASVSRAMVFTSVPCNRSAAVPYQLHTPTGGVCTRASMPLARLTRMRGGAS
jgi:hypothetical protein